jgi:hypothetical protein
MDSAAIQRPPRADTQVFFRSPALAWTILSLLLFVVVEGLVFRLGWYNKYLEPASSAGTVEDYLSWLKRYPHARRPEVMVIGDSRIAEGFSARAAGQNTNLRFGFWNFGIGGSAPRIWYYMLRDGDPTRRRFAALVIPFDGYPDEDRPDPVADRPNDLNFAIGRLKLSDCLDFALSMESRASEGKALGGCLFKGIPLRRDAQAFLEDIPGRIQRTKDFRNNGLTYIDDYSGLTDTLQGLSADYLNRTIHFPPGLTEQREASIHSILMRPAIPQRGEVTRYRKLWIGRILDLYKDSPTRIIFLELPRGPVPRPDVTEPSRFLDSVSGRPRLTVLPSSTFRDMEKPEFYFDGLHFNRTGRGIFTARLAAAVEQALGRH